MKTPRLLFLASSALLALSCSRESGPEIKPSSPPSMSLRIGNQELRFDPPEIVDFEARLKDGSLPDAPKNFEPSHEKSEMWPGTLRLTPLYDPARTHILGGLFRSFQPESLTVSSEDGTLYRRDADYLYQEDWGLIANKDGRLSGKILAKAKGALSRLDLIQRDAAGNFSVKKGSSALVCPELPQPDPGQSAFAGVYIAPWRAARNPHYDSNPSAVAAASEYAITEHEIFPILPAETVHPIAPEQVSGTLKKLRAGEPVKIAFMGDSITLGAEATRWWEDKYDQNSTPWKGRFIHALRQRFPKSKIEVVEAYRGGVTIAYGLENMPRVLAEKPDLVIAAFGANDADGKIGEPAKYPAEEFGKALASMAEQTKAAGGEILFVTTFPLNPWLKNGAARRLEEEHIPALKKAAKEQGAAVADVNQAYRNLNRQGIPFWSQNHNWTNHPGNLGHRIYSDTILAFFPAE